MFKIQPQDLVDYHLLINSLNIRDDRIPNVIVQNYMSRSGLARDVLSEIWKLAKLKNNPFFTRPEFFAVVHLIKMSQNGIPLPSMINFEQLNNLIYDARGGCESTLRPNMALSPKQHDNTIQPTISHEYKPLNDNSLSSKPKQMFVNFSEEIPPDDRRRYIEIFDKNVISITQPKKMNSETAKKLLQSYNLSNQDLADIWNLVDQDQDGFLTQTECVLALYLCEKRFLGVPLPSFLSYKLKQSARALDNNTNKSKIQPKINNLLLRNTQDNDTKKINTFKPNYDISLTPNIPQNDCPKTESFESYHRSSTNINELNRPSNHHLHMKINQDNEIINKLIDLVSDISNNSERLFQSKFDSPSMFNQLLTYINDPKLLIKDKINKFYKFFDYCHTLSVQNPHHIINFDYYNEFMKKSYYQLMHINNMMNKPSCKQAPDLSSFGCNLELHGRNQTPYPFTSMPTIGQSNINLLDQNSSSFIIKTDSSRNIRLQDNPIEIPDIVVNSIQNNSKSFIGIQPPIADVHVDPFGSSSGNYTLSEQLHNNKEESLTTKNSINKIESIMKSQKTNIEKNSTTDKCNTFLASNEKTVKNTRIVDSAPNIPNNMDIAQRTFSGFPLKEFEEQLKTDANSIMENIPARKPHKLKPVFSVIGISQSKSRNHSPKGTSHSVSAESFNARGLPNNDSSLSISSQSKSITSPKRQERSTNRKPLIINSSTNDTVTSKSTDNAINNLQKETPVIDVNSKSTSQIAPKTSNQIKSNRLTSILNFSKFKKKTAKTKSNTTNADITPLHSCPSNHNHAVSKHISEPISLPKTTEGNFKGAKSHKIPQLIKCIGLFSYIPVHKTEIEIDKDEIIYAYYSSDDTKQKQIMVVKNDGRKGIVPRNVLKEFEQPNDEAVLTPSILCAEQKDDHLPQIKIIDNFSDVSNNYDTKSDSEDNSKDYGRTYSTSSGQFVRGTEETNPSSIFNTSDNVFQMSPNESGTMNRQSLNLNNMMDDDFADTHNILISQQNDPAIIDNNPGVLSSILKSLQHDDDTPNEHIMGSTRKSDNNDEVLLDDSPIEYDSPKAMMAVMDYTSSNSNFHFNTNQIIHAIAEIPGYFCIDLGQEKDSVEWVESRFLSNCREYPNIILDRNLPDNTIKHSDLFQNGMDENTSNNIKSAFKAPLKTSDQKACPSSLAYMLANVDYQGDVEDIPFKQGDILISYEKHSDWFFGYGNGVVGAFPSNCVSPITLAELLSTKEEHIASNQYVGNNDLEIDLQPDEKIVVYKTNSSGWVLGENLEGKIGWFPSECLASHKSHDTVSSDSFSIQIHPSMKVKCLDPYVAELDDELSFNTGDIITVLDQNGDWWMGELNGVVGLFPSNFVVPLNSSNTNADINNCESFNNKQLTIVENLENITLFSQDEPVIDNYIHESSINELVSSENKYLNDLSITLEVFYNPMLNSGIFSKTQIEEIFLNWRDLMSLSADFSGQLNIWKENKRTLKELADIIEEHFNRLDVYVVYFSGHNIAVANYNKLLCNHPEISQLENACVKLLPKNEAFSLLAFLIKPLQRLTKYPLLLREILKSMPIDHPQYGDFKKNYNLSKKFCENANDVVRQQESMQLLIWLQDQFLFEVEGRKMVFCSLIDTGNQRNMIFHCFINRKKNNRNIFLVLCNDFLAMASYAPHTPKTIPFEGEPKHSFTLYKQPIHIKNLDFIYNDTSNNEVTLCSNYNGYTITLKSTEDIIDQLITAIKSAKENYKRFLDISHLKSNFYDAENLIGQLQVNISTLNQFPHDVLDNDVIGLKVCVGLNEECTDQIIYKSTSTLTIGSNMTFSLNNLQLHSVSIQLVNFYTFFPPETIDRINIPRNIIECCITCKEPIIKKVNFIKYPSAFVEISLAVVLTDNV